MLPLHIEHVLENHPQIKFAVLQQLFQEARP